MWRVAASMPWAMIWSTFWVMTAESALPSNTNTSAPYFSWAYFFASAAWAWWNTLDRSDTKNAIFLTGFAAAAGAAAGAAGATTLVPNWVFSHVAASAAGIVQKEML